MDYFLGCQSIFPALKKRCTEFILINYYSDIPFPRTPSAPLSPPTTRSMNRSIQVWRNVRVTSIDTPRSILRSVCMVEVLTSSAAEREISSLHLRDWGYLTVTEVDVFGMRARIIDNSTHEYAENELLSRSSNQYSCNLTHPN